MSEAPKRIWINPVYGQHPEDWDFTDGKHLTKKQLASKVKYVRDDLHTAAMERAYIAGLDAGAARAQGVCLIIPPEGVGQRDAASSVRGQITTSIRALAADPAHVRAAVAKLTEGEG